MGIFLELMTKLLVCWAYIFTTQGSIDILQQPDALPYRLRDGSQGQLSLNLRRFQPGEGGHGNSNCVVLVP